MSKILCINLKDDLYKEVEIKAKDKQLSMSAFIRLAIIEYLRKEK